GDKKDEDGSTLYGLREWEKHEFKPREAYTFHERLYAIRYVDENGDRYYKEPSKEDLNREDKVIKLLLENFEVWQSNGYIPQIEIENGDTTSYLIKSRGWKYWFQLSNPRQLIMNALLLKTIFSKSKDKSNLVIGALALNRVSDRNTKLCRWDSGSEKAQQTFYNQAFNTLYNYVSRGWNAHKDNIKFDINLNSYSDDSEYRIETEDARKVVSHCNIWITDPPYADAINYHELTEFFLAWDKILLEKAFPEWYTDSKRVLAVKGIGQSFHESMITKRNFWILNSSFCMVVC
ncbi:MAG: DNA methylase, partial [Tissierellales bacterium]|nr:DNA methylase [Tissierellales bacterium]